MLVIVSSADLFLYTLSTTVHRSKILAKSDTTFKWLVCQFDSGLKIWAEKNNLEPQFTMSETIFLKICIGLWFIYIHMSLVFEPFPFSVKNRTDEKIFSNLQSLCIDTHVSVLLIKLCCCFRADSSQWGLCISCIAFIFRCGQPSKFRNFHHHCLVVVVLSIAVRAPL